MCGITGFWIQRGDDRGDNRETLKDGCREFIN